VIARRVGVFLLVLAGLAIALGFVFAGSSSKLAQGVEISGVDVGGLSTADARRLLEQREKQYVRVSVVFTAAGHSWRITPDELGVANDWTAALAAARREGSGFGPLRGFKRLDVRVFGAKVIPSARVFDGALSLEVNRIARAINRPHRDPALRLHGTHAVVVPGHSGAVLDREAARRLIVAALSQFERGQPVALPVRYDPPTLAAAALAPAQTQVAKALSAPVRLQLGPTRFRLSRARIASLLELPADGRRALRIGGPVATAWLTHLSRRVASPPRDADFNVSGSHVTVIPGRPGLALDPRATGRAILAASLRPLNRTASVAVVQAQPKRTTADAQAMAITGLVSTYTTAYGGIANRIHNVQLVAHLVDDKLIAPGAEFSFNKTTGARTAAKGFLEAPVIINGELSTGLGGGVCQVSTTVFNTAYEAGLKITARTNHALYISHYPQGRDATVDYPGVDLRFVNDTGNWLLLRTFVGPSELTVSLYGTPTHRRVVSETSPLVVTGNAPIKKTVDATLKPGEQVVDDPGEPAMSTSVHRLVYDASGKVIHDDTFSSHYVAAPELVRVGPKKAKKPKKPKPAQTSTLPGATTPTAPVLPPTPTTPTETQPTTPPTQP
jgi:vancomycin resistance protein YoaR